MSLPVAVQLYSVRDDAARDLRTTLKAIREMGYDGANDEYMMATYTTNSENHY